MDIDERLASSERTQPQPRRTFVSRIVYQVLQEIRSQKLKPGDKLPSEKDLGAYYGVGRSSVREAIQQLASLGMINVYHGRGAFVAMGPTPGSAPDTLFGLLQGESLVELLDVRKAIEARIAELAAQRATQEDILNLKLLVDQISAVIAATHGNHERYLELNTEFHLALARMSGNSLYVRLLASLTGAHWDTSRSAEENEELLRLNNDDHRLILEAIEARNGMAAAIAMRRHIERTEQRVVGK